MFSICIVRRMVIRLVVLALLCSSLSFQTAAIAAQDERAQTSRHLIICVDGVGFSTIEKMQAEGRFSMFQQPSRMIAPFPTLTNVAMTEVLQPAGASEAAGYEDDFYDVEKNKMRGGLLARFSGNKFIKGTFRELFDYHPSAIKSGLGYAAPPASTYLEALTDIVRLRQKFKASREPVFFAYIGSSDSLAHLGGESMLRSFLARLDETVKDLVRESRVPVEVTIFSDHGNHFRGYKRIELKSILRRAGMRLESRVKDERSVVFPQFGLVGCAVLFTKEANEARLAEVTARARGVDFAAYENGGIVHIVGRNGEALIERRGETFRYRVETGDPLDLSRIARKLSEEGVADADGFIADRDWFTATQSNARPDAVRRIYEGLMNHVRNRANVIVNFEDGYYTGSLTLDIFAILQATHGNIGREQSYGFIMNTSRALSTPLRADDLWAEIGSPALRKSPGHETNKSVAEDSIHR